MKIRIRMLTRASGPDWRAAPGEEVERPKSEAQALVAGGYAEAVEGDEPEPEREAPEPRETLEEAVGMPDATPARGGKRKKGK